MRGNAVYDAMTDAHRLIVRIRASPCVDTMSGDRHSLTVDIQLDGRAYRGCGDALARCEVSRDRPGRQLC